jgi:hypothetical protein
MLWSSASKTTPNLWEFSAKFSLRIISRLANAAATCSGLAEWVKVIEPGGYRSIMSFRPMTAESGKEEVIPLPQTIRSGFTP